MAKTAPFRLGFLDKEEEVVVIALGARFTIGVVVRKLGDALVLRNYAVEESPIFEKGPTHEVLGPHLRKIKSGLNTVATRVVVVLGMGDALLRTVDLPPMASAELRGLLRRSSMHLLQQDLADYELDCHMLAETSADASAPSPAQGGNKRSMLVGGAKAGLIEELLAAAKDADMTVARVAISQVSLTNAALLSLSNLKEEVVGLADLGFRSSAISFLVKGEPGLTRVVNIGGDRFTTRLAEAFGVPYNVAEGLKTVMPEKVEAKLRECVVPLGHELREAKDFFESQREAKVARVFVSGGTARSDMILQWLTEPLEVPCERWDATAAFKVELPEEKAKTVAKDAPQLTAALGAAAAWFNRELIQLDLLAARHEEERLVRSNPVRKAAIAAGVLILLVLAWAGQYALEHWMAKSELARAEAEVQRLQATVEQTSGGSKRAGEIDQTLRGLEQLSTNRFLHVLPLNALQFATVEGIQVVRMNLQQEILQVPGVAAYTKSDGTQVPAKPPSSRERYTLTIRAKNTGPPGTVDRFIESVSAHPYFAKHLRRGNPVILKERMPPQVDPLNPASSFVLFTIDCIFADRTL